MTSYTTLTKQITTFKWIIKDFNGYVEARQNSSPKEFTLRSATFLSDNNKNCEFHLKLHLNKKVKNAADQDWLSLYLHWDYRDQSIMTECCLYILNNDKKFCKQYYTLLFDKFCGSDQFYDRSKLLETDLLPYGVLTIGCDIIHYNKPTTITPTYETTNDFTLKNHFKSLYQNKINYDFTFVVDNQEFKAHKFILIARSPVFRAMINAKMIEGQNNRAKIYDIRPKIFEVMLKFVYTDDVDADLSKDDAAELLEAADKYMFNNLKEICGEIIFKNIKPDNAMQILLIAEKYNHEKLIIAAKEFINNDKHSVLKNIEPEYFLENPHHAGIFIFESTI